MVAVQICLPPDRRSWREVLCGPGASAGRYSAVAVDDDSLYSDEEPKKKKKRSGGVFGVYAHILQRPDSRLAIAAQVMLQSSNNVYQVLLLSTPALLVHLEATPSVLPWRVCAALASFSPRSLTQHQAKHWHHTHCTTVA